MPITGTGRPQEALREPPVPLLIRAWKSADPWVEGRENGTRCVALQASYNQLRRPCLFATSAAGRMLQEQSVTCTLAPASVIGSQMERRAESPKVNRHLEHSGAFSSPRTSFQTASSILCQRKRLIGRAATEVQCLHHWIMDVGVCGEKQIAERTGGALKNASPDIGT